MLTSNFMLTLVMYILSVCLRLRFETNYFKVVSSVVQTETQNDVNLEIPRKRIPWAVFGFVCQQIHVEHDIQFEQFK